MKIRKLLILTVFLSLLTSCGGGGGGIEPEAPPSGGTNPWDANRGKVVTPSGDGWTSKTIDEGVVYYAFSGTDAATGLKEEVFAVDLDLSRPQYRVKLLYTAPRVTVSEAFKRDANTVAAMNANYEVSSIFVRTDGTTRYQIPKNVIGNTDVPNWKSEAAFTSDGGRNLSIFFAGSPQRNGKLSDSKGKTYDEVIPLQRNYYASIAASCPYLISSAPMLIDDFEPVGEAFCDYTLTDSQVNALNGEDPNRHQRALHPRTAIALTENQHFIMLVVDGRTNYSSGMSARDLTRFLVRHFNPQYALNMDGGGSSTLCVKGEGDPDTHVVNYPCDNIPDKNSHDHSHERPRDVHFVILK